MPISCRLMIMKKLRLLTSHRWYLFLIVMRKCMYPQMYVSYLDNKCDCVVYFFLNGFCICRFFDRDIECIYKFFNKRYARKLQLILGTEFFLLKFLFFLLGSILHQRKKKNKMDLKVMLRGIAGHLFCL